MSASNLPRHGDNIIEQKKDALGGNKLVASFQFQQFLDSLGAAQNEIDLTDINQLISGLILKTGGISSKLSGALLKKNNPESWVFVNSEADFPSQDDTTIYLEDGKIYIQGARITTAKRFVVGQNVALTSGSLGAGSLLEYTGSDVVFTGVDMVTFYHFDHSVKASNASQGYDFSDTTPGTTLFQMTNVTWRGTPSELAVKKIGTFDSLQTIDIVNSAYSISVAGGLSLGVEDGLTITGTTTILSISKLATISFSSSYIGVDWSGSTISVFEITNLFQIGFTSGAIGFKCDRNSVNIVPGTKAVIRDCEFIGDISLNPLSGGTSRDIRYDYQNNPPIPDSGVIGTLQFDDSVLVTTMTAAATPTHINAEWDDGQVEERLCFQDKLTFDNTTDICTTANGTIDSAGGTPFNHNFTAGDIILLIENGGLPTGLAAGVEYYVGSLTANTFQLYPDDTLTTPVDFTTDGIEPNYYCHITGTSKSGWFVLQEETGISPKPVDIEGWVSAEKSTGGNVDVRSVIMKTDTSFTITRDANGQRFNAKNGITGGGGVTRVLELLQGEGFMLYIENVSGTADNIVSDAALVAKG